MSERIAYHYSIMVRGEPGSITTFDGMLYTTTPIASDGDFLSARELIGQQACPGREFSLISLSRLS